MPRIPFILPLIALSLNLPFSGESAPIGATPPPTDYSIRHAVEMKLFRDEVVASHDIDTQVEDGVVTLTGQLQNYVLKERAVQLAKTRRGVRGVVDQIEVRPFKRPDDQIAEAARHAIDTSPLHEAYEDVDLSVSDGTVFLTGAVPTGIHRQLVASITAGITGVRQIENRIALSAKPRSDEEIRLAVKARLENDLWLADSSLQVDVVDGHVSLAGSVVSDPLRDRAARLAWVRGAETVFVGDLNVAPLAHETRDLPPQQPRSDAQIARAIEATWENDPRLSNWNTGLKVTVINGEATLTGDVPRLSTLAVAADDAQNVYGVRRLVNLAKVRPRFPVADEAIRDLVRKAVENDPLLATGENFVKIAAQNGRVELQGLVENEILKRRASRLAARIAGVKEIRNRLKTETELSGPRKAPRTNEELNLSDAELKSAIESEIFWAWEVAPESVKVVVDDGVATLSGTVENFYARNAATEAALEAGAPSVINGISVMRDDASPSVENASQ